MFAAGNERRLVVRLIASVVLVGAAAAMTGTAGASAAPVAATASPWTISNPKPPSIKAVDLTAVDCVSATWCMAVGYDEPPAGGEHAVSETYNGTAWKVVALPKGSDAGLNAVSCTSSAQCVAVGSTESGDGTAFIDTWDGTGWTQSLPSVPTSTDLTAVSCASPTFCALAGWVFAGGGYAPVTGTYDGSAWTFVTSSDSGKLLGISCPTASFCLAVGDNDATFGPLATAWNGTAWADTATPSDPNFLSSVSCPAATFCLATDNEEQTGQANSETFNGTAWGAVTSMPTVDTTGSQAGPMPYLSVSCPDSTDCLAVGGATAQNNNGTKVSQQVAATWNGTAWSQLTALKLTGSTLLSVSCPADSSCLAIGRVVGAAEDYNPVSTVADTGTVSSLAAGPAPVGVASTTEWGVNSVSCPTAASCTAVGFSTLLDGNEVPLVEDWSDGTWSTPELLSTDTGTDLNGVSCTASEACVAVGDNVTVKGTTTTSVPAAVTVSGTTLTATASPPSPSGALQVYLDEVSCRGTTCVGVGYDTLSSPSSAPLAEVWNGTSWSLSSPVIPTAGGTFNGVSCPTATSCLAVGGGHYTGEGVLAETWNGSAWTEVTAPNGPTELESVSCPAAGACVAVGADVSGTKSAALDASTFNGSTWTTTGVPSGSTDTVPTGISCQSVTSCVAVTNQFRVSDGDGGAVLTGSGWTDTPLEKESGYVTSVSCPSATQCLAVGVTDGWSYTS